MDNAVKNTKGGFTEFSASADGSTASVTVRDTGSGFSTEQLQYYRNLIGGSSPGQTMSGMGMHMIIELAAIMDATVMLDSAAGEGSAVPISFAEL